MASTAPRNGGATKWRDQTIITLLEKLGKVRDLDDTESSLMERTVRRLTPKREVWRWSKEEDRLLVALCKKRAKAGRTRPYQRNDDIRDIAQKMGRTEWAVYRRIERLRKIGKVPKLERWKPRPNIPMAAKPEAAKPDFTGTFGEAEAADFLGVKVNWLIRMRSIGGGPKYVKFGRVVRYPEDALRKFPVVQIMDENESRAAGWLEATVALDENRDANVEYKLKNCSDARVKAKG